MRNNLGQRIVLILAICSSMIALLPSESDSSISSEEMENDTFFVLGMLDEYMSRRYVAESDLVEGFYWGEKLHAYVMVVYLRKIIAGSNIVDDIEIKRKQDLLVQIHSKGVLEYLNSFYCFAPTESYSVGEGTRNRIWFSHLEHSTFSNYHRFTKLAYLAGAYFRYGRGDSFEFANNIHKARLIAKLLEDVGCPNPKIETVIGGAPAQNYVDFKPTEELKTWFSDYPGYWAIEAADTIFGFGTSDELQIYRTLIDALQHDEIKDFTITSPCVLMRITGIRGDGDRKMKGLDPEWDEVLSNFNERRTEYISLSNMVSDSVTIEHDYRKDTDLYRLTFLRIGFDESISRALTFLSHNRKIYSFFFEKINGQWKLYKYDIDDSWRGIVFGRSSK